MRGAQARCARAALGGGPEPEGQGCARFSAVPARRRSSGYPRGRPGGGTGALLRAHTRQRPGLSPGHPSATHASTHPCHTCRVPGGGPFPPALARVRGAHLCCTRVRSLLRTCPGHQRCVITPPPHGARVTRRQACHTHPCTRICMHTHMHTLLQASLRHACVMHTCALLPCSETCWCPARTCTCACTHTHTCVCVHVPGLPPQAAEGPWLRPAPVDDNKAAGS